MTLIIIAGMLICSGFMVNAALRKMAAGKLRGAPAASLQQCPKVKSCEEQRREDCNGKGHETTGSSPVGVDGKVLVLAMANTQSDLTRVNIFVRSCKTNIARRGAGAHVVILTDQKAEGDRLEIFQLTEVTEVVYKPAKDAAQGEKWRVLRDYLSSVANGGYSAVMLANAEEDMCQRDPFLPMGQDSGALHAFEVAPG